MADIDETILGVCSYTEDDRIFLCSLLADYFGDELTILPLNISALPVLPRSPKAVLVTKRTRDATAAHFPESVIIQPRRFTTGRNLEEVIKIPEGNPVLVANYPETSAHEAVSDLRSLGIHHLELVPYWHGCEIDLSRFETAIYVGIRAYAPERIRQYINMGSRAVSIATLVEILGIYGLPLSLADKFLDNHTRIIVEGCYRIETNLREMRKLKEKFEQVCNSSANVEIGIDKHGTIQFFSPNAERFFDLSKERAVGTEYAACLHDCAALLALVDRREDIHDELVDVRGKHCLASVSLLHMEGDMQALLTLVPLQDLQKAEAKARAGLHAKGFATRYRFRDIRGHSKVLRRAIELAKLYAGSEATVLLSGESGTGKELFAQAIHNASSRAGAPFVGVNFAAMPENLAESELFGHVEGAFTGSARGGKMGLFEIAHGGTIFLDEIGDASPFMQSKLLRVLEEREILRVGGTSVVPVDVRVLCATNKILEKMVREGTFREDLYYRIRVLSLNIPPLRERKEDIADILRSWDIFQRTRKLLPLDIFDRLLSYDWPGNVRELKSITEYLSILEQWEADPQQSKRQLATSLLYQFFHGKTKIMPLSFNEINGTEQPGKELPDGEKVEILRQIALLRDKRRVVGRYSLAEQQAMLDAGFTAAKLRPRLKKLQTAGYITVGRTRQGIELTSKALDLLGIS